MNEELDLITFDLDDTVWPCAPVIDAAEQAALDWLERHAAALFERHDAESLKAHRAELMARRPDIAHDITALRRASLAEVLGQCGLDDTLADRAIEVFLEARHRVRPYPDAVSVLASLARRFMLASLTNGNADVVRTPLRGRFHFCLTAADAGAAKPEPALFLAALERAGVPPQRALHVGDHPEFDIAAAQRVGMRTAWVNRAGLEWPGALTRADVEVVDLHGLRDWLDGGSEVSDTVA